VRALTREKPEAPVLSFRISLLAIALSLVMTGSGSADDVRKRGDKACGGDSRRMCTKHFPDGDMAILGCLQQNKVRLSRNCHKFLTEIGQLH
jgi:hypothetical protein